MSARLSKEESSIVLLAAHTFMDTLISLNDELNKTGKYRAGFDELRGFDTSPDRIVDVAYALVSIKDNGPRFPATCELAAGISEGYAKRIVRDASGREPPKRRTLGKAARLIFGTDRSERIPTRTVGQRILTFPSAYVIRLTPAVAVQEQSGGLWHKITQEYNLRMLSESRAIAEREGLVVPAYIGRQPYDAVAGAGSRVIAVNISRGELEKLVDTVAGKINHATIDRTL